VRRKLGVAESGYITKSFTIRTLKKMLLGDLTAEGELEVTKSTFTRLNKVPSATWWFMTYAQKTLVRVSTGKRFLY
jgi:hypothetical protein